ncbi:GTP-binding protein 8 [Caerostris darwini]|uniref:GTP-binding protein 8 n=1 Tax=Caerostris darwini TaxID=1538125 RepID=A0AAV4MFQ8_9ARAC|nr:GTP-binding protein 8 [Caerostris darwini]
MGRSNVGKSSLLKAIFNYVPELRIKTSKRAGLTKSAQFYGVGSKLCLVDMPGYGYGQPEWFEDVVHDCLRRRNCVRTFLLIDGKVGFQDSDDIALNALESYRVPYAIVMTKIDKATDARLLRNVLHLRNIKKSPIYCYMQPFFVSSHTFEGLGYLLAYIAHITGNLRIDHSDMNHISN